MPEKDWKKKSKYEGLYKPALKYLTVNGGDNEIRAVTIRLPDPPALNLIDGYGLPPEQQKFYKSITPPRLKMLEDTCLEKAKVKYEGRLVAYMQQEFFWQELNDNMDNYKEEIAYIKKQWWYIINGYWCFIFGRPYWIPPKHYFYLTFYYPTAVKGNRIEYRDEDRQVKTWEHYCDTTTETFKDVDDKGNAVPNDDGTYEMIDVGHRTCVGDAHPKRRRKGVTMQNSSDAIHVLITGKERHCIVQADTGKSAEDIYQDHVLPAWKALDVWLRPVFDGNSDPADGIHLKPPSAVTGGRCLNGYLIWNDSAKEGANDRRKIHYLLNDEVGKCFGAGTKIKMSDGTDKPIEQITVGDWVMGVGGRPNEVISTNNGVSMLYNITPNKSESWVCDENHILHCMVSDKTYIKYFGSDTLDISVKDYMSLQKFQKRSLMLYKSQAEYPNRRVKIPAYYLGYWLGDGSRGSLSVATIEPEVVTYLTTMCENFGMSVTPDHKRNLVYGIRTGIGRRPVKYYSFGKFIKRFNGLNEAARYFKRSYQFIKYHLKDKNAEYYFEFDDCKNTFLQDFKDLGVWNEKRIPDVYLRNSRDVRLNVLAGLIDSDGYVSPHKRQVEIACVYPSLAQDIVELCRSLGFSVSIANKETSCRQDNGYHFNGHAYRINIFGRNLGDIPCLVSRKKENLNKSYPYNRNPLREGFEVTPCGNGNYFGITLKDSPLFLLHDYTVVHNCSLYDVNKRWRIDKYTMIQGTDIHGTSRHPSTIEEMNLGGEFFQKVFFDSNFYQRDLVGMTTSGLFRLFRPVYEGWDDFIDEWGFSVVDSPTAEQLKNPPYGSQFSVLGMGSKEFWQRRYDALLQDPTKHADYRIEVRKHPMVSGDCWRSGSSDMGWDYLILDQALANLRGKSETIRGNFIRNGDIADWVPCDNGRFVVSNLFLGQQNQWTWSSEGAWNEKKQAYVPSKIPKYPSRFSMGVDPYDFRSAPQGKKSEFHLSKGGIGLIHNDDPNESHLPIQDRESGQLICYYEHRLPSQTEFFDDIIACAVWYGALINLETNLKRFIEYATDEGYGSYLWRATMPDGTYRKDPGTYNTSATKSDMLNGIRDFIAYRAHKCKIKEFLVQARDMRTPAELTKRDGLAGVGWGLYAAKSTYGIAVERIDGEDSIDLVSWYGDQYQTRY